MSTSRDWTQGIAVFLAGTALVVACASWLLREPAAAPLPIAGESRAEALATRADLEQRVEKLETQVRTMRTAGPVDRQPLPDAVSADLAARVESLEARAAASSSREPALGAAPLVVGEPRMVSNEDPETIRALRAQAVDTRLTDEERLQALRELRKRGDGARNGEVALAMIAIAMRSQDPRVRADVWRQMSGAEDPALVQPLLQSLAADLDEKVREEAAETLGDFLDLPNVRAALEYATRADASSKVQRQARFTLANR